MSTHLVPSETNVALLVLACARWMRLPINVVGDPDNGQVSLVFDPDLLPAEQDTLDSLIGMASEQQTSPDEYTQVVRTHAAHLRDFRDAVRSGTPVTNAQTLHVIADIIDWIRLTEDRL